MHRLVTGDRSGGQSLVEFALVMPIIILLLLGILDLGRGVFAYNTLAEAARQANRLAIVDQDAGRVQAEAVAYAPAVGLTAADVAVCFKTSGSTQRSCQSPSTNNCGTAVQIGCLAIVTTRTTFTPIAPLISLFIPSLQISSTSIGPVEHVCPTSTKFTCP